MIVEYRHVIIERGDIQYAYNWIIILMNIISKASCNRISSTHAREIEVNSLKQNAKERDAPQMKFTHSNSHAVSSWFRHNDIFIRNRNYQRMKLNRMHWFKHQNTWNAPWIKLHIQWWFIPIVIQLICSIFLSTTQSCQFINEKKKSHADYLLFAPVAIPVLFLPNPFFQVYFK